VFGNGRLLLSEVLSGSPRECGLRSQIDTSIRQLKSWPGVAGIRCRRQNPVMAMFV
jgi:hypothetical protein